MAKRGYKLQEFVAHSGNVNCLSIGRKTLRNFLTGGDDQKVNLWSIGKPTCLTSLAGHTSPVESVAFDSAEVLVLAGSSSGAIKLWDLEETKMVRTVTGHRSYCTALEFHPFGEFFASGSMDTNLKIWDIRKKGCIHTYKGHTRGISTIRFSPDGRWVVSGGLDNVVKVWDLTAGKLLHDFKFHEGHVRSMEFHPLEFLLATGSADKTVKFWDLETFEMIGSTRREGSGVRSITFHPDGRTLFCGTDDGLKVFSWEPVICHDSVDMGWSTLGDLCISDGKLLGGAYHENSVAVWVADISLIEPCGGSLVVERNSPSEEKVELQESPLQQTGSHKRSSSNLRSSSPENDSKEIKNIYIDSGNCVVRKEGSICSPTVAVPSESKDMNNHASQKQGSSLGSRPKSSGLSKSRSFTVPSIITRNNPDGNESFGSRRESISTGRASSGVPLMPPHMRNSSHDILNIEKMSLALETKDLDNMKMATDTKMDTDFNSRLNVDNNAKESSEDKHADIKVVAEKTPVAVSSGNVALDHRKEVNATKFVNGVAVVRGRTRSLVERFEKRESLTSNEISPVDTLTRAVSGSLETSPLQTPDTTTHVESRAPTISPLQLQTPDTDAQATKHFSLLTPKMVTHAVFGAPETSPLHTPDTTTTQVECRAPTISPLQSRTPDTDAQATKDFSLLTAKMVTHAVFGAPETSPLHKPDTTTTQVECQSPTILPLQLHTPDTDSHAITQVSNKFPWNTSKVVTPRVNQAPRISPLHASDTVTYAVSEVPATSPLRAHAPEAATQAITQAPKRLPLHTRKRATPIVTRTPRTTPLHTPDSAVRQSPKASPLQLYTPDRDNHTITQGPKTSPLRTPKMATPLVTQGPKTSVFQNVSRQAVDQQESGTNDSSVIESLMQSHELLLSTFRSRLTKLQVVRHFWERNDVKGAINATTKLPDYSVQADVVSVLVERMGFINLDLFSCLLPMLVGLLDSKVERHTVVSLEMLLKLVAVFGPVVHSTVSAPPAVGVDLHAEERLECCKECFVHLQNVRKILPELTRRGGALAKSALELNLVLQQS